MPAVAETAPPICLVTLLAKCKLFDNAPHCADQLVSIDGHFGPRVGCQDMFYHESYSLGIKKFCLFILHFVPTPICKPYEGCLCYSIPFIPLFSPQHHGLGRHCLSVLLQGTLRFYSEPTWNRCVFITIICLKQTNTHSCYHFLLVLRVINFNILALMRPGHYQLLF